MALALCDLPNELLISIVDFIDENNVLCSLAQVSQQFSRLAATRLYRNILLRTSGRTWTLHEAIERCPWRASLIHSLQIVPRWRFDWGQSDVDSGFWLPQPSRYLTSNSLLERRVCKPIGEASHDILKQSINLRELLLESPLCNYGRWRDDNTGLTNTKWEYDECRILLGLQRANLQSLTKLTLNLNGPRQRYWDPNDSRKHLAVGSESEFSMLMDKNEALELTWAKFMAMPSLEFVEVSCALIHDKIFAAPAGSTNLKQLNLVECNITAKGLTRLLAAPKALKKLYLGENAHHAGQGYSMFANQKYNNLFGYNPSHFITALSQQAHSLEEFTYISGDPKAPSEVGKSTFAAFERLQTVRLSELVRDECRRLLLETAPALESLTFYASAVSLFNPIASLETELGVDRGAVEDSVAKKNLGAKVSGAALSIATGLASKNFRTLHIVMPHGPVSIKGSRKIWVQMLAEYWHKRDIHLNLYYESRRSIFPPVLFDEEGQGPKDVLLFSAANGFTPEVDKSNPFDYQTRFDLFFDNAQDMWMFDDGFLFGQDNVPTGMVDFESTFGL